MSDARHTKSLDLATLALKNYQRKTFLFVEIGVYDGYNAYVVGKEALQNNIIPYYVGFDFFGDTNKTDLSKSNPGVHAELQSNPHAINKLTIESVSRRLTPVYAGVKLFQGNAKDTIPKQLNEIKHADLYFIDGGHTYDDVKRDYTYVKQAAKVESTIVFDDPHVPGIAAFVAELNKYGLKFGNIVGSVYIKR